MTEENDSEQLKDLLWKERDDLRAERDSLKEKLDGFQSVHGDYNSLTLQLSDLGRKLTFSNRERDSLKVQSGRYETLLRRAEDERQRSQQELADALRRIDVFVEQKRILDELMSQGSQRIEELRRERDSLKDRLLAYEGDNENLSEDLRKLNQQIDSLKMEWDKLKHKHVELLGSLSLHKQERDSLAGQLDESLANRVIFSNISRQQIELLTFERNTAMAQLAEASAKYDDLFGHRNEAERQLADSKRQNAQLSAAVAVKDAALTHARSECPRWYTGTCGECANHVEVIGHKPDCMTGQIDAALALKPADCLKEVREALKQSLRALEGWELLSQGNAQGQNRAIWTLESIPLVKSALRRIGEEPTP